MGIANAGNMALFLPNPASNNYMIGLILILLLVLFLYVKAAFSTDGISLCKGFLYAASIQACENDGHTNTLESHLHVVSSQDNASMSSMPEEPQNPESVTVEEPDIASVENPSLLEEKEDHASSESVQHQDSQVPQPDTGSNIPLASIDDEEETSEQTLLSTKEAQDYLAALKTVRINSELAHANNSNNAELLAAKEILRPFSGSVAMSLIRCLSGQELLDALGNISFYATLRDNEKTNLSIPGLGTALIMNYFRPFVKWDVYRNAIALFHSIIPDNERIVEPLATLIGCSKNRVYKANNNMEANGLIIAKTNDSNAGRPSIGQSFEDDFRGICEGAQVDPNILDAIHDKRVINESLDVPVVETNAKTSENTDGNAAPIKPVKPIFKSVLSPFVKLGHSIDRLHTVIPVLSERLRYETLRRNYGVESRIPFMNISRLLDETLVLLDEKYHYLRALEFENTFFMTASQEELEVMKNRSVELPIEMEYMQFSQGILENIVSHITMTCLKLTDIFSSVDHDNASSYWIDKKVKQAIPFKRMSKDLSKCWFAYSKAVDLVETEKKIARTQDKEAADSTDSKDEIVFDRALIEAHYRDALEKAEDLTARLEERVKLETANGIENMHIAVKQMQVIQQNLRKIYEDALKFQDTSVTASTSMIIETYRRNIDRWLNTWAASPTSHSAAVQVSAMILSKHFVSTIQRLNEDFAISIQQADHSGEDVEEQNESKMDDSNNPTFTEYAELLNAAREEAQRKVQDVQEAFSALKDNLVAGAAQKTIRKNSKQDHIQEAVDLLNRFVSSLDDHIRQTQESDCIGSWESLGIAAWTLNSMAQNWLNKWIATDDGYIASFSTARLVSESIIKPKHRKNVEKIWSRYDIETNSDSSNADHFITVDALDEVGTWFQSNARLNPARRAGLIRKFVTQGKDPTDIKVWLDYIVCEESSRTYGDPTSKTKCCSVTKAELANAFAFLTGIVYSPNALWNILKVEMHYSGHQCAKLDQIGTPNPYRFEQYDHITKRRNAVDMKKTLVLSVDTKAFILLGRLKHDHGLLMCSNDGNVYRVHDHDYGFLVKEIYSSPNRYVGAERMNEKAALHPVGALCLNDMSGYVSLVLGKDTAESMCNLITKVFLTKKKEMPELDSILVLADGGGANSANGILWIDNLLNVSEKLNVSIEVCHYAPGCSRHNPVEAGLWSPVSIHWRGKPFLDIEHVIRYVSETRTGKNKTNVKCWFDTQKYMTNTQKKACGIPVLTRKELDEKADGRISYPFPEGTDMHRWNYVITPRKSDASQTAA